MSKNVKQTSENVASTAAKTLTNPNASSYPEKPRWFRAFTTWDIKPDKWANGA